MLKHLLILFLAAGLAGFTGCSGGGVPPVTAEDPDATAPKLPTHPDWMGDLGDALREVPLNRAVFPGSHDAGTYSIKDSAPISPDLTDDPTTSFLKDFVAEHPKVGPVNAYIARWARAQGVDLATQLKDGIRYFDLRACASLNGEGEAILVVHSLYGGDLLAMVDEVYTFLDSHPKEVVLLDFSHFYAMGHAHHQTLIAHLKRVFGSKLVPHPEGATKDHPMGNTMTFGQLWDQGQQVVCMYHDDEALPEAALWRGGTPEDSSAWWPRQPATDQVKATLDGLLLDARPRLDEGVFFVLQTVLTADPAMITGSVLRVETEQRVAEAATILSKAKAALKATNKLISSAKASIVQDKKDIKDDDYYLAHDYWNPVGAGEHEADKLKCEGDIKVQNLKLKPLLKVAQTDKEDVAVATANLAEVTKALEPLLGIPTTLQELALQGDPAMLGWLNGWRDQHLNVIIMDWSHGTEFMQRVLDLNRPVLVPGQ